jgi:hypothetical protein
MKVTLIRMWSGEDVVADLLEDNEDNIVICNGIVAVPTSPGQIGFSPWSPLLKGKGKQLTVPKSYVVYMTEDLQDGVVEQYNNMYSDIIKPSSKLVL